MEQRRINQSLSRLQLQNPHPFEGVEQEEETIDRRSFISRNKVEQNNERHNVADAKSQEKQRRAAAIKTQEEAKLRAIIGGYEIANQRAQINSRRITWRNEHARQATEIDWKQEHRRRFHEDEKLKSAISLEDFKLQNDPAFAKADELWKQIINRRVALSIQQHAEAAENHPSSSNSYMSAAFVAELQKRNEEDSALQAELQKAEKETAFAPNIIKRRKCVPNLPATPPDYMDAQPSTSRGIAPVFPSHSISTVQASASDTRRKQNYNIFTSDDVNIIYEEQSSVTETHNAAEAKVLQLMRSTQLQDTFTEEAGGYKCKPCTLQGYKKFFKLRETRTNKDFHNFKESVKNHIDSIRHQNCAEALLPTGNITCDENARKAAMNLALDAYHRVKQGLSFRGYPEGVAVDGLKDVEIGKLNHSHHFPASMVDCFGEVLREKMKEVLAKPLPGTDMPRPVSILADKYSYKTKSLHLVGISFLDENDIQVFLLDAKPIKDGTCNGVTDSIYSTLVEYFPEKQELRDRVKSFSFDGQYFVLGVPNKLLNEMGVSEVDRHLYSFVHDPAHIIELAGKTSREEHVNSRFGVELFREVIHTISGITKTYNRPKMHGEIEEVAELMKELLDSSDDVPGKLYKFRYYSATRFSTYFANTLGNVFKNYPYVHQHLETSNQTELFSQVSDAKFLMRLASLIDVYKAIGETSLKVQQSMLPWHYNAVTEELTHTFEGMRASLNTDDTFFAGTVGNWMENFQDVSSSLAGQMAESKPPSYKGRLLSINSRSKPTRCDLENVIDQVKKESADHIKAFNDNLKTRLCAKAPPIFEAIEDCFSITKLKLRTNDFSAAVTPEALQTLYQLGKKCGYIEETVSFDQLREEYQQFVTYLSRFENLKADIVSRSDEKRILLSPLFCDDGKQFVNVSRLLADAVSRVSSESPAETFGSFTKLIWTNREQLSTNRVRDELLCRVNGLPTTHENMRMFLTDCLNVRFGGPMWHTIQTSQASKLMPFETSKVVDKMKRRNGGLTYNEPLQQENSTKLILARKLTS